MHHTCLDCRGWLAGLSLVVGLFAVAPVRACNVPVFRYALEHWEPERYEVLVVSRGPLGNAERSPLRILENARDENGANLDTREIDVAGTLPQEIKSALDKTPGTALPCLLVRNGREAMAWSAPLTEVSARQLLDSPARHQLVQELLAGKSCVWVLVESGDKAQDDAAAGMLEKELKSLQTELELPVPAVDDPQIQAGIPLQLAFGLVRVSRRDPAEAAFVGQLLAGEPEAAGSGKPVAFPVFGRGRALPPMFGEELGPDLLAEACKFIIGGCSCAVKELNPGKDLLLLANWDAALGGAVPEERPVVPQPVIAPGLGTASSTVTAAAPARNPAPAASRRMLLIALGLVAMIGLLSGISLLGRKN